MNKNVLVIDDDSVMLRLIMSMLRERYSVAVINSGLQAVKAIHQVHPSVVLLDVLMPEVNGIDVLKQIRLDSTLDDIPVLLMSGTYDEGFIREMKACGAQGFVTKPIDRNQLLGEVAKVAAD